LEGGGSSFITIPPSPEKESGAVDNLCPSGRIARDSHARRRSHVVWAPPHKNFLLKILAPAFDSLSKKQI